MAMQKATDFKGARLFELLPEYSNMAPYLAMSNEENSSTKLLKRPSLSSIIRDSINEYSKKTPIKPTIIVVTKNFQCPIKIWE